MQTNVHLGWCLFYSRKYKNTLWRTGWSIIRLYQEINCKDPFYLTVSFNQSTQNQVIKARPSLQVLLYKYQNPYEQIQVDWSVLSSVKVLSRWMSQKLWYWVISQNKSWLQLGSWLCALRKVKLDSINEPNVSMSDSVHVDIYRNDPGNIPAVITQSGVNDAEYRGGWGLLWC